MFEFLDVNWLVIDAVLTVVETLMDIVACSLESDGAEVFFDCVGGKLGATAGVKKGGC